MLLSKFTTWTILVANINTWTTFLVFAVTFILVYKCTRRQPGVPPGPPLFPIVGNLPHLISSDTLRTLRTLRRKYGDMYSIYMGSHLTIFLNGYDVIQDALIRKGSIFANRPTSNFFKLFDTRKTSINIGNGRKWKELRRFSMNAMAKICFKDNGRQLEQFINAEAEILVCKVSELKGSFDIDKYVRISLANVICKLLFAYRFSLENERMYKFLKSFSEACVDFTKKQVLANCFPFLCRAPGDLLNVKSLFKRHNRTCEFLTPFIDQQREKFNMDVEPNTIVGMYLKQQVEEQQSGKNSDIFTDDALTYLCVDLLGAGAETTSSTIQWIIAHLIRNPRIQHKLYSDIYGKLDKHCTALPADRKRLMYVEAVIMEGLRMAHAAPLAFPHAVSHDIIFRGFLIPKDATILTNIDSAMKDPNIWENPDEFIPERFLNEDESALNVPSEFAPFSLGPRSCLGESLARMELFLMLVAIVKAFELQPGAEGCLPDLHGQFGLTYAPHPFLMSVKAR